MPTVHEMEIEGHKLVAQGFNEHLPGVPAVFLHGIGSTLNFWTLGNAPVFQERFRWYALSLPGHYPAAFPPDFRRDDLTPELLARLLAAAIRRLTDGQPALLFGHSTGGFLALALAASSPELVKAVITVGGFAEGKWTGVLGTMQWWARRGLVGEAMFLLNLHLTTIMPSVFSFVSRFYTADPAAHYAYPGTRPTLDHIYPDISRLDARTLAHYFNRMPDITIADWLPRISAPTLVIAGERDPIVPPEQSRLIAERVANSKLALLKGCGHLPMSERGDEYIRLFTAWLAEQGLP